MTYHEEVQTLSVAGLLSGHLQEFDLIRDRQVSSYQVSEFRLPAGNAILDIGSNTLVTRTSKSNVLVTGPLGPIAEIRVSSPEGFCAGFFGDLPDGIDLNFGAYLACGWDGAIHLTVREPLPPGFENVNVSIFPGDLEVDSSTILNIQVEVWTTILV